METKKTQTLRKLKSNIKTIKNFGVERIGLFGSVVKGMSGKDSDIDIIVEFKKEDETFSNLMNLYFFLEKLFGRKVDLVTKDSISPYIKPYILKEVVYIEGLS
ncbi:MAG: nucleotidyltransferase [Candidatus Altiarchaeales archaeon IMC4]|nr:MAG: nucleotidyltransferase [Candidatus Altiarchaeales archaeon IMC4]